MASSLINYDKLTSGHVVLLSHCDDKVMFVQTVMGIDHDTLRYSCRK